MTRATTMLAWLLVASGCNKDSGGGSATPAGSAVAAAPAQGSGGGFSADLAKQLDIGGGSSAAAVDGAGSSAAAMDGAGSSAAAVDGAGSSAAAADGAGSSARVAAGAVAPAGAAAGSAAPSAVEPKARAATGAAAGSAAPSAADPKVNDAKAGVAATPLADPKVAPKPTPPADGKPAKPATSVVIESGTGPRTPVSVPAELKAITMSLLPNWERDVEAAGTISLRVKIPNRTESALFVFRYGYEDPQAPAERDAYKKWLADAKVLTPKDDRQKGAAWYLEGTDGSGKPAFRFVVNYGGKKLVCYGSLYKDAASTALGDLRDQTILQAKQICETLAL